MARGQRDQVKRDQIEARLRQGDDPRSIARDLEVGLTTVYDVRVKELGITGKNSASQLTIPLGSAADPEGFGQRVSVQLSHDQFVALGDRSEAIVVAGMIQQESLKKRLLRVICEQGPFEDVLSLMRAARGGPDDTFGSHEVTHLLKESLNKQGLVTYRLGRHNSGGSSDRVPTKITATTAGYAAVGIPVPTLNPENVRGARQKGTSRAWHAVGKDYTEQRYHGTKAETAPIERSVARPPVLEYPGHPQLPPVADAAPTKTTGSYPMLEALQASFATRAEADARASRMADAAALIALDDPEEADRLLAKAVALSPQGLTELEKEYLRYVAENE